MKKRLNCQGKEYYKGLSSKYLTFGRGVAIVVVVVRDLSLAQFYDGAVILHYLGNPRKEAIIVMYV